MLRYIARRSGTLLLVIVLITFSVFALTIKTRDPAVAKLGESATREQIAEIHRELGLDRPLLSQYGRWLAGAVRGDLGASVRTNQPVEELIWQRLGVTLELTFLAIAFGSVVGIAGGVVSAVLNGTWADTAIGTISLAGVAIPNFWLGLLLMLLFTVKLGWLPPSGYVSPFQDPVTNLKLMLMPAFTLSLETLAVVLRLTRSSVVETLAEPYVLAARSRGVPGGAVVIRYALRTGLIPVVTFIGVRVGRLFGGAIVVETLFGVPGIGRLAVDAMYNADFPVILGVVLLMAITVGVSNLVVDLLYGLIDPRVKLT